MMIAVVFSLVLVQAFAMTTPPHMHPTHPTHPPHGQHGPGTHEHGPGGDHGGLHETHEFTYMEHENMLLAVVNHNCYLMQLSDAQKMDVQDPMKLHDLEAQLIKAIDAQTYTALTHDDQHNMHMDPHMTHKCHGGHVYKMNSP